MPSRADKERNLRRNIEISTEREYRDELKKLRQTDNPKLKEKIRKEFEKSAERIDKTKLHEVWNG
ncbi:hypothetical protein AMJ80_03535 [bacterium SM23_31]|nr:MAG: hypothetical protein AMJ80_03535 [bacterium SM23_31]